MTASVDRDPTVLPPGLPVPADDGAAAHLEKSSLPNLSFPSTHGGEVELADLSAGGLVLYVYPKMGRPGEADPAGWNEMPGARGCTPQSCAFRDLMQEFAQAGYRVAGLSAQETEEQHEAAERLHLPFPLLADPARRLGKAVRLPTFEIEGLIFYKRLTLVAQAQRIVKVFYPVFPPNENAQEVLDWVRSEGEGPGRIVQG